MQPIHISVPRERLTLEWKEGFEEFYDEPFEDTCQNPECGKYLVVGDFVDSKYPFETAYCVCAECEPIYSIERADRDHY